MKRRGQHAATGGETSDRDQKKAREENCGKTESRISIMKTGVNSREKEHGGRQSECEAAPKKEEVCLSKV